MAGQVTMVHDSDRVLAKDLPRACGSSSRVERDQLLGRVGEVSADLSSTCAAIGDPSAGYIRWANDAARTLRSLVIAAAIDRLVLTRRYSLLPSMPGSAGTPNVTALLNAEFHQRSRVLEDTERALRERIQRWSRPGGFLMPDTSFCITHPERLENVDLATLSRRL